MKWLKNETHKETVVEASSRNLVNASADCWSDCFLFLTAKVVII